jgi:hypothetical protein
MAVRGARGARMAAPDTLVAYWTEHRAQLRQSESQRAVLTNYVLAVAAEAADVLAFNEVVPALVDYYLAKRTQTGLQLHRLVQGVIRARHPQTPTAPPRPATP